MRRQVKQLFLFLSALLGVPRLFRKRNEDKFAILMYHGVVEKPLTPFCWTHITKRQIQYQLKYLKTYYSVLSLSEVIERIQRGLSLPRNTAVVTFDDGYRNNYTIAYPLLQSLQIPATIFLVTRCISEGTLCWPDALYLAIKEAKEEALDLRSYGLGRYRLKTRRDKQLAVEHISEFLKTLQRMQKDRVLAGILASLKSERRGEDDAFVLLSWEEIARMSREGLVEFGGHTATHNIVSRLGEDELQEEITGCCDTIEKQLGTKCRFFAYPNGRRIDFDRRATGILKANGIVCALATIPGLNSRHQNLYELKRIGVAADVSKVGFQALVTGSLSSLKRFH